MSRLFLSLALLGAVGATAALGQATERDNRRKSYAEEFKKVPAITGMLGKAKKVVLHEGLPHQTWEAKLLETELKTKKTVKLNDFPFYQVSPSLTDDAAKELTALFRRAGSLKPYAGPKRCGGFHPDYAVDYCVGTEVYRVLICFGCHEVKFYGPKTSVHCDVSNRALDELQTILKPYQKNRPAKKKKR
jgi:hypothetical protein